MGLGEAWTATRQAARAVSSAAQSSGRAGAGAARRTGRAVHRMTGASGANRTGLASLMELTAVGAAGDAFVTIALAGTLFFSASLDQARGRIALTLIITMAPFAVLAPLIGPMLDRAQQGRRYLLAGTLMARGLLCWGMVDAVLHNDVVALLPAAFGVLVLQKAYAVIRASVTPRLLPPEITLVTANSRTGMASLIAGSVAGLAALGIVVLAGGGAERRGLGAARRHPGLYRRHRDELPGARARGLVRPQGRQRRIPGRPPRCRPQGRPGPVGHPGPGSGRDGAARGRRHPHGSSGGTGPATRPGAGCGRCATSARSSPRRCAPTPPCVRSPASPCSSSRSCSGPCTSTG